MSGGDAERNDIATSRIQESNVGLDLVKSVLGCAPVVLSRDELATLPYTAVVKPAEDLETRSQLENCEECQSDKLKEQERKTERTSIPKDTGSTEEATVCENTDDTVICNLAATSEEDFNDSNESSRKTHSSQSSRSFRIPRRTSNIITCKPRSESLPFCFKSLSFTELTSPVYTNKNFNEIVSNYQAPANQHLSSQTKLNIGNVIRSQAPMTPPPSYRSLTKQNLMDVPPLYEIVTGLSLNVAMDPALNTRKSNSRNHRTTPLPKHSKIMIIVSVVVVLMVTLALVLAEAFANL
eukprot:Seg1842.3 transcript_id=Seg1842.3/GoldUCD/mRNA.D3Y31 product="hypothetical protein" protein_id=Seg1842.3/GoldUCD/D3Y31